MNYLGDFIPGALVVGKFNTHRADGTPITFAGTPVLAVYDDSTNESTSGITLTVDYDARTGLHRFSVDTSADAVFYAAGTDFQVVVTAGTVDGVSVVGTVVASFSIDNRSALSSTAGGLSSIASAVRDATVLDVVPSARLVDQDGTQITAITLGQALAAVLVNLLGDRSGIGTRSIAAALPGATTCHVTADRVSSAAITMTIQVPTYS